MRSWRTCFTALLIAETFAMIGFSISAPLLPLFLEEDLGITDPVRLKAWVGFIHSSSAITLAIFAPIWGNLADIFSRRAMLLRAMFGGAIIFSLTAFVTSPMQFMILKLIQGCLIGTVSAATVLTVAISPAAQVAFALGLLQTMIAVGNSLGPMVGGFLADIIGYRAAFFSTGMILALAGLLVLLFVDSDSKPASPDKPRKKFSLIPDINPIKASPILIAMMLVSLWKNAAITTVNPMLPLFVRNLLVATTDGTVLVASTTGMVMGIGAASSAIAAVLVGKFSSRLGYWRTLVFCLSAAALMYFVQGFTVNIIQLTILRAFSAFFIGGATPVLNAIIAVSSDREHQGTIFGINTSVASAGNALGPIFGSFAAIMSFQAVFTIAAVLLGLSAWITVRGWKKSGVVSNA